MKNIFIYFISLFVLSGFAAKAQTPSVSLTLTCPGSAVVPGSNFIVDAAYGYSNVSGNIVVVVNYDNTMVSFCGSPGFSTAPVPGGSGTTSTLTYTFPASSGANQTGAIQLCFNFLCPQTCFGTSLSANFTGNISSPTNPNIPGTSCTASGTVLNNWAGQNYFNNYDCVNNRVTFRLRVNRGTCYKINNPSILLSPSIGTVIGPNPIVLGPLNPSLGDFDIYYTIQLDCSTDYPSVLTCGAVLNGDNCGSPTTNLIAFGNASFNIPANTTTAATLSQGTYATSNSVWISNTGNTPLNATLSTQIPLVKVNTISFTTSQSTGVSVNYTLYDCNNLPAGTGILNLPTSALAVTSLISNITYTVNNLSAGQWFNANFAFDKTLACNSPIPDCHKFITSGDYVSFVVPGACNCTTVASQVFTTVATEYCPRPEIGCSYSSSDAATCKKANDAVHICFNFYNYGTTALTNGILTFPWPSYLNYNGNLTFNSSSSGVSGAITAGNLVVTLPPSIAAGSGIQTVCFDATVNSTALNGLFYYNYSISGDNYTAQTMWCSYGIRICEDPKVEIEKLVKGSLDASFTTTGNGMAGTYATYQITVKNVGNTPIDNIEIIDRTPESGDKTIRTCASRGSDFSMMPNGVFNPTSLSSSTITTYAHSVGGTNQVPSTWTALPSCNNTSSSFSAAIDNTVKINLPTPILPFSNYTFEMRVLVPAGATAGQKACNSIAIKCNYLDVASNPHPLEIIESELACLIIAPPPCDNCKGLLSTSSLTMNPGTTTSASTPYVTATGYVTITTLQPVQEIRLSVADLQYHWDKPGCTNCKGPTITRGCLFPQSTTQTIGTLVWDDYTGNSIPTATPVNNCPEELIWKLGVMLVPGTYTIPIQLTLPKGVIPDCCELIIDKFDIKVSIKDKDCKVCDSIIRPRTDDCCTGSYWINKQMSWSLLTHTDWGNAARVQPVKDRKTTAQFEEAVKFNKQLLGGTIFANPMPWYGVTNVDCRETYRFMEGVTRTFSGSYACNTSLPNCTAEVLISITTISGDFISVVSQPLPYTQTFNLPGTYRVKYVAKCGGKICNTCEFTVVVEKNCCTGLKQSAPSTITTNSFGWPAPAPTTVNIANPVPGHYSSLNNAIVKLYYQCAPGCTPTYEWVRRRNGVIIGSGTSESATIPFPPPANGEDLITITVKCGNQSCNRVEQFYLGCKICSIVVGPNWPVGVELKKNKK